MEAAGCYPVAPNAYASWLKPTSFLMPVAYAVGPEVGVADYEE